MQSIYWFILGTLAVWRVTHLLYAEDILLFIRQNAGDGKIGGILDCFYCLSLWISIVPAILIGHGLREIGFLWLGFSAGAILLQGAIPSVAFHSQTTEFDHVLRQEPTEISRPTRYQSTADPDATEHEPTPLYR